MIAAARTLRGSSAKEVLMRLAAQPSGSPARLSDIRYGTSPAGPIVAQVAEKCQDAMPERWEAPRHYAQNQSQRKLWKQMNHQATSSIGTRAPVVDMLHSRRPAKTMPVES
jgi:hypothetical protein